MGEKGTNWEAVVLSERKKKEARSRRRETAWCEAGRNENTPLQSTNCFSMDAHLSHMDAKV